MEKRDLSDIRSEAGVIGTLLVHPEYISHAGFLHPSVFQGEENACLYWGIEQLHKSGITNIDAYNLSNVLQSHPSVRNRLDKYNLPSVQELIDDYVQVARSTVDEYVMVAERVVTYAFKRALVGKFEQIESQCSDPRLDLAELSNIVYSSMSELTERFLISKTSEPIGESIDSIWDEIVSRRNQDGSYGLTSKFSVFDDFFTYERGELVVLQAKYKQGKSVFLMNEAVDKLKKGIPTMVVDMEMPTRLYVVRLLAHLTGIDANRIKSGKYSSEDGKTIADAIAWIKRQPFVHVYNPELTMEQLYSLCELQRNKMGLGFLVYDYLKSNEISTSDNYNALGAKCDYLKNRIAGKLDIPVLAACQLNRMGEVADSIKINQYLSVGIKWGFKTPEMIASDGMSCGNAYAKIYVNRLGRQAMDDDSSDYIDFVFSGDNMRISEAEQHFRPEDF